MLVHSDPTDAGLSRHRQGLPPSMLLISDQATPLPFHLVFSTFPNCPAQSSIKPFYQLFKFSTF
jgi:hypothetical protein